MNTTQLRTFATEARKSLLSGVKSKMNALGFKDDGTVDKSDYPIQAADGTLFQGEFYDVAFYGKWMRLHDEIARHGFRQVCEEGAYTWFNRLMAIQILAKNGLINPVLEFESSDVRIPLLVKQAHEGICPDMSGLDASRLKAIIADDNRITDQFAILIVAFCQSTPILYKCFGTLNDFTELLLPTNILASNGFLSLLNGSSFITAHDYESTELIGWLYQFYIAERKDEVFASFKSGHKAEADDIPAATQIFTPNWIVKYMVQNTLGRIYLDNNPDSPLKDEWKYLIDTPTTEAGTSLPEPVEGASLSTSPLSTLTLSTLENLTFADLSCGSGHILNEAFDVLFAIYKEEGYTRRQAIKAIFEHNITGVDIDTRARQLATFALMLKACQQWPDAIGCEVMPRVLDMPNANYATWADTGGHMICNLELPWPSDKTNNEITQCFVLLQQAHNLGSIMKFEVSDETREYMKMCIDRQKERQVFVKDFKPLFDGFEIILALTDKYAAIAMNPPYMGRSGMNNIITQYVRDYYPTGKWDLFSTFMIVATNSVCKNGLIAMLNMQSWMFLDAFEDLRKSIVNQYQINNMLHLGPNTFDELSGEVVQNTCFVLSNSMPCNNSIYFRLCSGEDCLQKEKMFLNGINRFEINQELFSKIPGSPIAYWLDSKWFDLFENKSIDDVAISKAGIVSGDDNYFVRYWHEVTYKDISLEERTPYNKYHLFQKGGSNRRYYGNNDYVFKLKDFWDDIFFNNSIRRGDVNSYFKKSIGWSYTGATENKAFRQIENCVCGTGTPTLIVNNLNDYYLVCAYLNSKIASRLLPILNPTLSLAPGYVIRLPYRQAVRPIIQRICEDNVFISKQDWDAHETSWDFKENELVRYAKGCTDDGEGLPPRSRVSRNPENGGISLEDCLNAYKHDWEQRFGQLHANEEELNRQFIEIYGLQDELTPDVPLDEITILQQGEISIEE